MTVSQLAWIVHAVDTNKRLTHVYIEECAASDVDHLSNVRDENNSPKRRSKNRKKKDKDKKKDREKLTPKKKPTKTLTKAERIEIGKIKFLESVLYDKLRQNRELMDHRELFVQGSRGKSSLRGLYDHQLFTLDVLGVIFGFLPEENVPSLDVRRALETNFDHRLYI